jgi:iron complex transport system substrate-binding protein
MRTPSLLRTWRRSILSIRWKQALVLSCAALVLALAACGGDDDADDDNTGATPTLVTGTTPQAAYPVDIPRSDGTTLTVEAPPQRIVSLSPAATEIIYALGAEASLVAVDNQADYPEAAANFPTKVDAFEPNVEAIAAADPDLVVVATDIGGLVAALDGLNIPVFYQDIDTDIQSIDDVFTQITHLGSVTGKNAEAEALIADLGERVQAVKGQVEDVDTATSPKIFHELDSTLFTVSENSFIGDLYQTLRAQNIAGDGGGTAFPQMTNEAVVAAAPDVMILADEEFGVTVDSVKARPGWDTIPAVSNNRIIGIDPDIISRPGPRIVDALEQLGVAIYPERFE